MRDYWLDVRHALRALGRRPGFTFVAVVTLALGIGACTAMSAAVYRLLLAPLPFAGGERMGFPWLAMEGGGMRITPRRGVVEAWAQSARSLEWLERFASDRFTVTGSDAPESLAGGYVSETLAPALGVRPVLGRYFVSEDTRPGEERVVLLDEAFWRRRHGGDRAVLGQRVMLNGEPHTIVGVMPSRLANFMEIGSVQDLWVPFPAGSAEDHVNVLVKLREGVDSRSAESELNDIAARVVDQNPMSGRWTVEIRQPSDWIGARTRQALVVLFAAVGAVLLIACANVAGLLFARGEGRRRETAIMSALGASRRRLLRHLSAEIVLLGLSGGALGLVLATWAVDLVRALRPADFGELEAVAIEPAVLGFCFVISMVSAAVFGVVPTLIASRVSLMEAMKGTSGGSTGAAPTVRLRAGLVVAQIALSTVLFVSAGLLIQMVADLQRRPLGFRPDGLLKAQITAPESRYPTDQAREALFRQILEAVESLPGVASAALTSGVPPGLGVAFGELAIEGKQLASPSRTFPAAMVHPAFFRTLGLSVLEGRGFADEDAQAEVVVINQAMARKYWPGESAVGKRMRLGDRGPWQTIVGVVNDIAAGGPASRLDTDQLYFPMSSSFEHQTVLVRASAGDPAALAPALRALVARIDLALPLEDVATVESLVAGTMSRDRFNTTLLSVFAALALALAAIGIYGLVSFSVAQRTREIGVRVALGAAPGSVRGLVLRQGLRLLALGLGIGIAIALAAVRLLDSVLHDMQPYDPLAFTAAAVVIGAAVSIASWVPASRAASVDPLQALRSE